MSDPECCVGKSIEEIKNEKFQNLTLSEEIATRRDLDTIIF